MDSVNFFQNKITCIIELNSNVSRLCLLINNKEKRFSFNNNLNFYYLQFEFNAQLELKLTGIVKKNKENLSGTIRFLYQNENIETLKFNSKLSSSTFVYVINNRFKEKLQTSLSKIFSQNKQLPNNLDNIFDNSFFNYDNMEKEVLGSELNGDYIQENIVKSEEKVLEHTVNIFYGTNRKKTGKNDFNDYFGNNIEEDECLNLGRCIISIPKSHKVGRIERPGKILFWSLREKKSKHILLDAIQELDGDKFYNEMIDNLKKNDENSFLLFVHGYNNTFAETAWRTGQIAYDLNFKGVTGFFSWPSAGKTLGYVRDMDMASASITSLADFIHSIVKKTDIDKLHIIAHSMGNMLVTSTLKELARNEKYDEVIRKIDQIILAAPDIDQNVFKKEILPVFKSVGKNRTMYVSDKDFALKTSETLRDLTRLGQGGKYAFTSTDLYTIDASNVISPDTHSYIFDTKLLLNDLFLVLDGVNNPEKRNLRKKPSELWYFPE
ncbi:alpha/beta hydrolase [Chryseobacterium nepalense]|uniref:Alpha/beta hydrolase n=1 Tax=Chryseobacterium nepalense TaxID=1854498 RepID=A0ABY4KC27_9FLAO|nr:alpha/beta hydrolase [Chryseobacterium nepalense]UPQ77077.1 alpha/beta hydrolase [Chryseobacterium nepalense]